MNYDVAALGELLIDLTQNGVSERGNPVFEANPGGAPANVLAMLGKLGHSCAFLGKVGADAFGDRLEQTLRAAGIDTRGLRRDEAAHTTLAVVQTFADGDRDFSFYRKPGADVELTAEELDEDVLKHCRVFHFGSLSLTDEPARTATRRAVALARGAGALLSYDPNLRPPLWESDAQAREQIAWGLAQCDVLKIADNEAEFMCGSADFDRCAAALRERYPNIRLLNITAGAGGSYSYCGDLRAFEPACALGGVIAGLVSVPVVAVPTSVGYGASFAGIAPLLTMLNSCAEGMSVVNIDNGFGAGYLAARINSLVTQGNQP